MKFFTLSLLLLLPVRMLFGQTNKAREIVSQMTTDEKISLVVGMGMKMPGMNLANNGTGVGQTMDKVPGAAGSTFAIPRLGIPNTVVADGPAGLRILPTRDNDNKTYYATAWPIATLLASSWDTELVEQVGKSMGNEVKEYGVDIILGPALNIHRNPLAGRNFEYYSEDPVVSGNIAAAMVNGIQSNGVGTSVKHFAANNQETNRNQVNTILSQRTLREIYLRGFEILIKKANPWTVMSSYNRINGVYTSEDYNLLTNILRKEWGFKGYVMTDWFGGADAVAQMKAGNDLLMPGTAIQTKTLKDAYAAGQLTDAVLNENAERIVNIILISPAYQHYAFSNKPDLEGHAKIARQAAAEGAILLRNVKASLPLNKQVKKIAAFGNTSYDLISGGTGSGDVNEAYTVSLVDGLKNAGFSIPSDLQQLYENYIRDAKAKMPPKKFFFELPPPVAEMEISDEAIHAAVEHADAALLTIGRNSGEFQDRKKENDFMLTDKEITLIDKVSKAFHAKGKKLIVILNTGGVMEVASWRDKADAILLAWQGGQEAGNAIADILSGKVTPSGKLATTFPVNFEDVSSSKNFPGKNLSDTQVVSSIGIPMGYPSEVTYEEGIYTGYRYYNSFGVKTAYPFGYGLSYTTFAYGPLKLSAPDFNGKITASMEVTNTGKVAGKEVVQFYLSAPATKMDKPKMELKGFAKTKLLAPGQKQVISWTIRPDDLASFDTNASAWVAEAGNYTVKAGASSEDIRKQAIFSLKKELVTEKCFPVMGPVAPVKQLKPF